MVKSKIPAAFVLSGGGALGMAHIGAIGVLEEKYSPDYLIGTSAGAIVAAGIACGIFMSEISQILQLKAILKVGLDFSIKSSGLIKGQKILDLLRESYDDRNFEDLPKDINLRICATNFLDGTLVVIKKGSIAEAVRASLSVPGLFDPYYIDGIPMVDGGLIENLPIRSALLEYEGDNIIGIDVCSYLSNKHFESDNRRISFRQSLERTFKIIFKNQQSQLPIDDRVKILQPDLSNFNSMDVLRLREIEEVGAKAAKDFLSN